MTQTPHQQLPAQMRAMVTMGHGDMDQMVFHDNWPIPVPKEGEVLVRVGACGLNNTDVNTRSGWYSKAVSSATTSSGHERIDSTDPSWGGAPISFPRIQGADVCGQIVDIGKNVDPARLGQRIINDCWLRDPEDLENKNKTGYFGSECDGGFAEYTVMPSENALAINSELSDAELATFSCSYSTAEGMLSRVAVTAEDTVLIPGASGGVGSALIQLAKYRGARVIALTNAEKFDHVKAVGADVVLARSDPNLATHLAGEAITVLADIVGGPQWPEGIDCLQRAGRYVCSGAIAGPMVTLDLRTLYLRDLTFAGSTVIDLEVMPRLVKFIETGAIKPLLAAQYPLEQLHQAQSEFIAKKHIGNIVICP